ncbi:MAG: sulfatase-like hydrolase/transferase [Alistipes putredinis]
MAVHEKKESFKEHNDRGSILLAFYFVLTLLIPNLVLLYTEPYSIWSAEASLFIPMGFYLMWSAVLKRSGIMIWLAFPLVVLAAFQIVLLYLFGNSIIATDMFTNLLTTNPEEAGELLSNIYPSIIIVCAIYLPLLWFASRDIGQRHCLSKTARKNIALIGLSSFILGGLFLAPAYKVSEDKRVLKTDIFPVNVFYNIGLCGSEFRKMYRFEHTSEDFTYHARRTAEASKREIYVYVIGEASRAANWQLYGYHRETNPCLTHTEGLVVFRNTVTQSNTTHKSVPLILSSVKTDQHEELYRRKGLPALFKEAGFKTWFLSNQRPQGAMIDKLAKDADSLVYLPEPRYDMQLLEAMKQVIAEDPEHDLLIILHCYGSHFTYHQRYPREFARFLPDDNVAINRKNVEKLVNAYDNSIYYTDHFLSQTIEYLRSLENDCSALLYCADHGERYSRRRTGALLARLPYDHFYQALCRQSGMVLAGISTGIPGKSRSGPQQRIRTGHNPLHVSKHGRYRFDRRRLHRSGLLVGQSDIRLPGTAPLSERSQPGRSFPENRSVG